MTTLKDQLTARVEEYTKWENRRQYGADGPNMRRLWVLACMDERLPVDEALGIRADTPVGGGDAHLFRNAGGIVTDDAIRSAMLTINFFGTKEIVVLQHTGCGMLSANGNDLVAALEAKGIDVDTVPIDPFARTQSRARRLRQVDRHDGRRRRDLREDGQLLEESSTHSGRHCDQRLGLGDRIPASAGTQHGQGRSRQDAVRDRHDGCTGRTTAPLELDRHSPARQRLGRACHHQR